MASQMNEMQFAEDGIGVRLRDFYTRVRHRLRGHNKRQVFVALFSRESHTVMRTQPRREMYHDDFLWSILIRPKHRKGSDALCVQVRSTVPEPVPRDIHGRPWRLEMFSNYEPKQSLRYLGEFMIGKLPNNLHTSVLYHLFASVPLPRPDALDPENGVTWMENAIWRLQQGKLVDQFDINRFMDECKYYATAMVHQREYWPPSREEGAPSFNYTLRPR
ncbi:hypothetical protein N7532_008118 [Penicillium argentinense]|uniref:Uncharacterized protein n=1 Tax=Penicillium argentinense TaxID=1131581 RepID=A0A9W9EWV1_9EURO|nr:uncharacterized protein N7532_008118 [Penicillium argentinense]KAJ5089434.1 hypothetical protein N7532_008118 [Penicillium argentinense]